jgi:hypothetical protein
MNLGIYINMRRKNKKKLWQMLSDFPFQSGKWVLVAFAT